MPSPARPAPSPSAPEGPLGAALGNWSETADCMSCMNNWIDEDNDCGTCPPNWDPDPGCYTCLGNWSLSSDCETCIEGWSGTDCEICRVYVDSLSSSTDEDGTTWASAFNTVQEGIDAARTAYLAAGDPSDCEVWVAGGTYYIYVDDPADTVQMQEHVNVYGGFAGDETTLDERNWADNPTWLDGAHSTTISRVYHVVTGASFATLDGFIIVNGNAVGSGDDSDGGGVYCDYTSPTIRNCWFENNHAENWGGAIYGFDFNGVIENCVFYQNSCNNRGGAVYSNDSNLTITNCNFVDNSAWTSTCMGGRLYDYDYGNTVVTNSIFWNNSPDQICSESSSYPVYVSYSLVQGGYPDGDNIIDANPGFTGMIPSDFTLTLSSPCIDAGDGDAAPEFDRVGNPRVDIETVDNSGTGTPDYTDIGAYERQ